MQLNVRILVLLTGLACICYGLYIITLDESMLSELKQQMNTPDQNTKMLQEVLSILKNESYVLPTKKKVRKMTAEEAINKGVELKALKAQGKQDRFMMKEIFNQKMHVDTGFFIEFGARNGIEHSNTYFFEKVLGWKGLLAEAFPEEQKDIANNRPNSIIIDGAISDTNGKKTFMAGGVIPVGMGGIVDEYDKTREDKINSKGKVNEFQVNSYRLDSLVELFGIKHVNLMSVDTEGSELLALKSFPWDKITVDSVNVEVLLGNDERKKKQQEIEDYMDSKGYKVFNEFAFAHDTADIFFALKEPVEYTGLNYDPVVMEAAKKTCQFLAVFSKTVKKYQGDKVYRYDIQTPQQQQLLAKLVDQYHLDLWTENIIGQVDVHVPKSIDSTIKSKLTGIKHKVYIDDLQKSIDQERQYSISNMEKFKNDYSLSEERVFSDYQDTLVYQSFLESLPGAEKIYLGKTYLGAEVNGVKFGSGDKHIVFHGGIHAREWIGPATVVYIANALSKGTDSDSLYLRKEFTFHVIPVLNVDGYDYTRNPRGDRMNRKNREPYGGCIGTDPNRNFPFAWSKPGASGDPCSDAFYGPSPGSSKEVQAITSYIKSLSNVVSYIDFHAYSQLFMFPFGHDCNYKNKDKQDLMNASNAAVKAIKSVNGLRFRNGELGVKYSFAVELRPTGFLGGGFLLPAKYIVPAGKETLAGVVAAWKYVALH
ncbi:hypothetical protein HK103_000808 [Boothiomyces macroporosus]|uniref:Peptidase M14 domain-containing protein n=1 Tax=Boothiomyces macroporosus TaxID=261099 RepID=A0AAD5UFB3_9FUNG|nr:hypothetical protein HK103_000808 [Boothiomyces macroporosus]